jgi:hypothetical protein
MPPGMKELALGNLYAAAREALKRDGEKVTLSRKSVIDAIVRVMGNEHIEHETLLNLYLQSVRAKIVLPTRLTNNRPYVQDRAMRLAAAKCAFHPQQIGIN